MEPDVLIILCLALLFFGGIIYLVLKERNQPKHPIDVIPALLKKNTQKYDTQKNRKS